MRDEWTRGQGPDQSKTPASAFHRLLGCGSRPPGGHPRTQPPRWAWSRAITLATS